MANYDSSRKMGCRRTILSTLLVIIGVALCGFISVFALNSNCYSDAQTWLPYYPNAEVVNEETSGTRMWGLGTSIATLYTTDESAAVRRFYNDIGRAPSNSLAKLTYEITATEQEGINIILVSQCGIQ